MDAEDFVLKNCRFADEDEEDSPQKSQPEQPPA
jgi:hypothetical protein